MDGMQYDIQKYINAVYLYNEYSKLLGIDYGVNIRSEIKEGIKVIFRSPQSNRIDDQKNWNTTLINERTVISKMLIIY
jgi:hypothetical protein